MRKLEAQDILVALALAKTGKPLYFEYVSEKVSEKALGALEEFINALERVSP